MEISISSTLNAVDEDSNDQIRGDVNYVELINMVMTSYEFLQASSSHSLLPNLQKGFKHRFDTP